MISVLFLALVFSIDALSVGFTYGIKKIKIPLFSRLLICAASFLCAYISVSIGKGLSCILPYNTGNTVSALLLCILGLYLIISGNKEKEEFMSQKLKKFRFGIKSLGLTITIVKHPIYGDFDDSKIIDLKEAVYIGLALSLDSIGGGIGYGVSTATSIVLFPILTAIFQLILISGGEYAGKAFSALPVDERIISVLPGIILITIAVIKLFT